MMPCGSTLDKQQVQIVLENLSDMLVIDTAANGEHHPQRQAVVAVVWAHDTSSCTHEPTTVTLNGRALWYRTSD